MMKRLRENFRERILTLPVIGRLLREYHALSAACAIALLTPIELCPSPVSEAQSLSPEMSELLERSRQQHRNLVRKLRKQMFIPILVLIGALVVLAVTLYFAAPDLADMLMRAVAIFSEQSN